MIVLLLFIILIVFYLYATKNHDYWSKRMVKHEQPLPLFGNHLRNILGTKSITEISTELYNKYSEEKVVGYYRGSTPELIVRDLDIAKTILNVDFAYFHPRGVGRDPKIEPLFGNLFHADGDLWKLLRQRITAAFTTARLKAMFPLIVKCANKLQVVSETIAENGCECDVRELMARFTTEFIGTCGFGIEMNTINDENCLFRLIGKLAFARPWKNKILVPIWELFPAIRGALHPSDSEMEKSMMQIVRNICEQRNYKPSGRNDFIDLLLELQNKGAMKGSSIEYRDDNGTPLLVEIEMDFQCLVAQVFVFFAAGFETSSSAASFTLHQLALHPEIQQKIQHEIDEVLEKYNNELCYDAVAEMSSLKMALMEAMRMLTPLGVLHRVCAKKYTFAELDITIDPGVKIQIPIQSIHNDERYFENPMQFNPERFRKTGTYRHPFSYIPFGAGPRECIGARLGKIQSLAGLAALLHKFSVKPATSTRPVPEIDHEQNQVQRIKRGLPLKLERRKI